MTEFQLMCFAAFVVAGVPALTIAVVVLFPSKVTTESDDTGTMGSQDVDHRMTAMTAMTDDQMTAS